MGGVDGRLAVVAEQAVAGHVHQVLDAIGLTLRHVDEITADEPTRPAWLPTTA